MTVRYCVIPRIIGPCNDRGLKFEAPKNIKRGVLVPKITTVEGAMILSIGHLPEWLLRKSHNPNPRTELGTCRPMARAGRLVPWHLACRGAPAMMVFWVPVIESLGGGFKTYFLFSHLLGEMIQFDYIFQMGWFNHKLGVVRLGSSVFWQGILEPQSPSWRMGPPRLGSPPFISQWRSAIGRGTLPKFLSALTITMVINHLQHLRPGMILQVDPKIQHRYPFFLG